MIIYHSQADMAKLVDAPDLGSGGKPWGFESLYPHQEKKESALGSLSFFSACVVMQHILKIDDYIRGSTTIKNCRALGSIFCCQKMQRFYARNFCITDQTRNSQAHFGRYSRAKLFLRS